MVQLAVPVRIVEQGHTALTVGASDVVWTFFLSLFISLLSPSLWETARYGLTYCLKGPLNQNTTYQPSQHLRP